MKLVKYLALELKAKKEGSLYALRNATKAADLILILNYLFYEHTKNDLDLIIKNLHVIDEEMDDEIVMHGNNRSLLCDLSDPKTLYICFLADYLTFQDSQTSYTTDITFVDELKNKKYEHIAINRTCFLQLLQDWHAIIKNKPIRIVLYQNKSGEIGFESFTTHEAALEHEKKHSK